MNRSARIVAVACLTAMTLVLSTGCGGGASYEGDGRAAVSGTVTFDGKPLPYGSILFMGQGKMASAVIENGAYSIAEAQGPNLGEYAVQITGYAEAPPEAVEGEDIDNQSAGKQIIPAQYNTNSTLKVTIAAGENKHDFALTTGG